MHLIHLIQIPGIEHEERPLGSKDSPDSDHATAWVMQLGPGQPSATCALCQEGVLAQLIQPCMYTSNGDTCLYSQQCAIASFAIMERGTQKCEDLKIAVVMRV